MFLPSHDALAECQNTSKSMWGFKESLEIPARVPKPKCAYKLTANTRAPNSPERGHAQDNIPNPLAPAILPSAQDTAPVHNSESYVQEGRGVHKEQRRFPPTSGEGGIRTPDAGVTGITVFETAAFNRSATSPQESIPSLPSPSNRRHRPVLQPARLGPRRLTELVFNTLPS